MKEKFVRGVVPDMNSFWMSFRTYVKAHKIITSLMAIILVIGGYYTFNPRNKDTSSQYVLAAVIRDTVISSVTGTGQISAKNQVDVKPLGSGQVVSVSVVAGQSVYKGQTLAVLDERAAIASIAQAKANLQSVQANYDKVLAGESQTDLAVDKASLASAQLSLQNTQQSLVTKITQAYTSANNDVANKSDPLFINPMFSPRLSVAGVNFINSVLEGNINNERMAINTLLPSWKSQNDSVSISSDLASASTMAINNLKILDVYFSDLSTIFNTYAVPADSSGASAISSGKSIASAAQSDVESLISSIQTAEQSLASAQVSFASSQATYNSKVAPPETSDVASAEAQLISAKASLQSAQNNYVNNIISAPIAGVLATVDINVGDQASSGTSAATIITTQQVAIIPFNEVEVSKVKIGQKATLTFDALPDLSITGKVVEIDAIGTVSQGVVTYNVKIALDTQNSSIKSGMSVSTVISIGVAQDVLVVPINAVKTQGEDSYVQVANGIATSSPKTASANGAVLLGATPEIAVVQTGLSNDTEIEVTSGVKEGDLVVVQTIAAGAKTTTTSAAGGFSLFGGGGAQRAGGASGGATRTTGAAR